jgi:hypothetical protein
MSENSQEQTAVAVITEESRELSIRELKRQTDLIKQAISEVMEEGHHYGTIPGCGIKKTLLKPGAEKLNVLFRLAPKYEIESKDLPNEHREYEATCNLYHIPTGQFVGQGVGVCSTMESKYRFRSAERTCPECGEKAIIKGKEEYGGGWLCFKKKGGCGAKFKEDDKKIISQQSGQVENTNPSDEYNTVKKMAKKRAQVDATLTATAASDSFTQDLEDIQANKEATENNTNNTTPENTSNQPEQSEQKDPSTKDHLDEGKKKFTKIFKQLSDVEPNKYTKDWQAKYLKGAFGVDSIWKCKANQLEKMRGEYKQLTELLSLCQEEQSQTKEPKEE